MYKIITAALFAIFMLMMPFESLAQSATTNDKTVTLVASGDGATKDEAVKQALRSAVEQTYGTFVSSNTEVLNDEVVQDEIVTVSTGNIIGYKILSATQTGDGNYNAIVEATVSIGQLTNFARSKGMSVDLEIGAFAMNMKIRKLNKDSEIKVIKDLQTKLREMGKEHNYFDYNLELSEPYMKGDKYGLNVTIKITPNKNLAIFRNTIISTLKALSLTEEEQAEYERANIPMNRFMITEYDSDEDFLNSIMQSDVQRRREKKAKGTVIALRNTDAGYPLGALPLLLINNELKCSLQDNLGKFFGFVYFPDGPYSSRKYSSQYVVKEIASDWAVNNFDPNRRSDNLRTYDYVMGTTTKGFAQFKRSKLFKMDDMFDFSIADSNEANEMINPMMAGPGMISYEIIFCEEDFLKIDNLSLKFRLPQYNETD